MRHMKITKTIIFAFLFISFLQGTFAANCMISLALDTSNNLYAKSVYDNDNSMQFVDVFVSNGTVVQYSFENVVQGAILINSVPGGSELSYSYSDYDGSMYCMGIFGNVTKDQLPTIVVREPTFLYAAEIDKRLAPDNISIWVDVTADTNSEHAIDDVRVLYSLDGTNNYSHSQALEESDGSYGTTLGPFTKKVNVRGRVVATDYLGKTQTIYLDSGFYEIISTAQSGCKDGETRVNAAPTRVYGEASGIAARLADATSTLTLVLDSNNRINAKNVFDDDSSIGIAIIHVINNGIDTKYEYADVVEGQTFEINIPSSATAYYNYSDYDGTVQGFAVFQQINTENPIIPRENPVNPVNLIASAGIEALPNEDTSSFKLKITLVKENNVELETAYLRYSANKDYSNILNLSREGNSNNYVGYLNGPYTELTIYGRVIAEDATGNNDSENLGGRWYKIVPAEEVKCMDLGTKPINPELPEEDQLPPEEEEEIEREKSGRFNVILNYNDTDLIGDYREILVLDGAGREVKNAEVKIVFPIGKESILKTNEKGIVSFLLNRAGKYGVTITKSRFRTFKGEFTIYPFTINYLKRLPAGTIQSIAVLSSEGKPITDALVKIISPNGASEAYATNSEGIVSFAAVGSGTYSFEVLRKEVNILSADFVSAGIVEVTFSSAGGILEALMGQDLLNQPIIMLAILFAMCFAAAYLAYTKSKALFGKDAKSTRQEKINSAIRFAVSTAIFLMPLQIGKYFGFWAAVAFAILELMAIMIASYWQKELLGSGRKAIKV